MRDTPLFFIHIPKTAGSSFRKSLERYFGKNQTFSDYGAQDIETTAAAKTFLYQQEPDFYYLKKWIDKNQIKVISGHVHGMRFLPLTTILNTITFIREPVSQVISHYHHYVNHFNYKGTLETFLKNCHVLNCQSRMLKQLPLELIGMVGLTEEYARSIELINHSYDLQLSELKLNKGMKPTDAIEEHLSNKIISLNQQDVTLYQRAKNLFQRRYQAFQQGLPWVFGVARINLSKNTIEGIAYFDRSDEPVILEIFYENEKVAEILSNQFVKKWAYMRLPRNGYVGFSFNIKNFSNKKLNMRAKNNKSLSLGGLEPSPYSINIPQLHVLL